MWVLFFDIEIKDFEFEDLGLGWGCGKGYIVGFFIGVKDDVGNIG